MRRVVVNSEWLGEAVEGAEIELESGAGHRVARVLRLKTGAEVSLFDGMGLSALCRVASVDGGRVVVAVGTIERAQKGQSSLEIHLVVAAPKGDRWEWLLQKASELGVDQVSSVVAERTQWTVPPAKLQKRLERWRRISAEAARQCGRDLAPTVNEPQKLPSLLAELDPLAGDASELRLVATARDERRVPLADAIEAAPSASILRVLVGPEGGLTEAEVDAAIDAGFVPVSLGPRVLRVETAAIAIITIGQHLLGDLG